MDFMVFPERPQQTWEGDCAKTGPVAGYRGKKGAMNGSFICKKTLPVR